MPRLVAFDIETIHRPFPDVVKKGIMAGEIAVDYVLKDVKKIVEKFKEKWWLQPEGSKPICIGFGVIDLETRTVENLQGHQTDNEGELAEYIFDTLSDLQPTHLVGYNSENFDMPILEASLATSEKFLAAPIGKWGHIDLAARMPKWFNLYRPLKGSPISACTLYGVKHSGGSGEDVMVMFAEDQKNKTKKVLEYCLEDVRATGEIFLRRHKLQLPF